ncbi:tRNA (adenine(22)-N(1))-methyltransferase [Alkalicoccus urumqiensis]|uniref:tRNA (Adenine(22)-N(1))-methyltransferase TrmK n=1 Tax=Alkalicoccus urumqiensis TaxID=1548213 RepID=A0A2P6MFU4_ALKUR|nr:class I SAM-dependent methyltransferase [Alkalicoccus urumqiensis]PRO65121.1 tRNA (adenine(22)-N(1))-methyltransferase TrmK [Alkalicoccus urumqiensis]
MNEQHLSTRLEKVAEWVLPGGTVADIGSDHAYLPVYLVGNHLCEYAIAGELNEGPLQSARAKIRENHLQDRVEARLGNGLQVLENRTADTVVIAGMGGPLIAEILEDGKAFLDDVHRLVLQPNIASDHVRLWLRQNDWHLMKETVIAEDGRLYEVLAAERGAEDPYMEDEPLEKQLWIGPLLMRTKPAAFIQKWKKEYDQLERIRRQLEQARVPEASERQEELLQKQNWIKEVLS